MVEKAFELDTHEQPAPTGELVAANFDGSDPRVGTDPAVLRQTSPVTYAAKIRMPVLLVHGEADDRAPVEHARRMLAALQAAGNAPEWLTVAKEGHGFYKEEIAAAFYDRLDAFLAHHLKPR